VAEGMEDNRITFRMWILGVKGGMLILDLVMGLRRQDWENPCRLISHPSWEPRHLVPHISVGKWYDRLSGKLRKG